MTEKPKGPDSVSRLVVAAEHLARHDYGGAADRAQELESSRTVGPVARALREVGRSLELDYRRLQRLEEVRAQIARGLLLDDVLDRVYESFRDVIPYDRIGVSLLEQGGKIAATRWVRSEMGPPQLGKCFEAPIAGSSLEEIVLTGKSRILNDLEEYLAKKPGSASTRLIVQEGLRSSLTCPLVSGGVPVGFLFFSSRQKGQYADAHVEVFEQIAEQLSGLIEKGRIVSELAESKRELEVRNRFIQETFGRYLSDEVVTGLLESPEGLKLGGEKRTMTLLMSDLRGFSALADGLDAQEVVSLLNGYLEAMTTVIQKWGGTIDEFLGDAILVLFGVPFARPDDAVRAAACAIEMQREMETVNSRHRERRMPEVEMGIGLHTGEVVVGNIGSQRRMKFGVVGRSVNFTSRIESYTVGGQILLSGATREALGDLAEVGSVLDVQPKGMRPVRLHDLTGLGGAYGLRVVRRAVVTRPSSKDVPCRFVVIRGKDARGEEREGEIVAVSDDLSEAEVRSEDGVRPFSDLRIVLGPEPSVDAYAKALPRRATGPGTFAVRFTSLPDQARRILADASQVPLSPPPASA